MLLFTATAVQAQITIAGNVYGGGNAGDTGGSTTVSVYSGDLNTVYGGARMANVAGSAFVHIDGEHASENILINKVYGGNDIAGTIGSSTTLPTELTDTIVNKINYSWNAFVRTSTKATTTGTGANAVTTEDADAKKIFIGQVYGGGNGEYDYDSNSSPYHGKVKPELAKTYLEIKGGTIAHVYGGGNAATVTSNTTIYINNPSEVVTSIEDANGTDILADPDGTRLTEMGLNTTQTHATSASFQFARVFGGNNKADMAIRPKWNLEKGLIRDLYGGGNEGRMTSPEGLLLQIEGAGMTVDNVYGGCRRADVRPLYNNNDATPVPYDQIQLDPSDNPNKIPGGYAARVRVLGGHVNNVYGGNDISGNVYGGNTVGILTHIYGNVYGGGNGSYAYTDNALLKDDPQWCDFYYSPKDILNLSGDTFTGLQSVEALNIFRPNAEKVSILVRGTEEDPVVVEGSLYVGGNSASLRDQTSTSSVNNRQTHIKIGSYVTIDNVFLGNNGENMVTNEILERYAGNVTIGLTDYDFSQMNLKDSEQFAKYMEGCAMKVKPSVVFESRDNGDNNDYDPYSTKFGSFFCGGNVGSILVNGKITVDFEDKVIIYDKVVGGCNNANVAATNYNAEYLGGMLGDSDPVPAGSPEGTKGDKLELNFAGLKIQPMRWIDENDKSQGMEWNTWIGDTKNNIDPATAPTGETDDPNDLNRRFKGGNIYGGCYNSGHVNGNVIINLNASVVDRVGQYAVFDSIQVNEGEAILYNNESYNIVTRRSGVILDEQGMDPLGRALNVFGGGYGEESEIWGSTTINLNAGYTFQIFGGGEKGAIGKGVKNQTTHKLEYTYNPAYSCYVNLKGNYEGVYRGHADDNPNMAEAEFIYGGSFEAPIAGNTVINLGKGRIFNSFAGSCNADILGHTETYIGRQVNSDGTKTDGGGFPWIRDHVYGGNDLGGRILNKKDFIDRVRDDIQGNIYNSKVTEASAYMEYQQGRVGYIFGGCYGYYDYTDRHYSAYTNEDGTAKTGFIKPRLDNAFVNFRPNIHQRNAVSKIYGAGQGYSGDSDRDIMQNRSYVLIDIPDNVTKYQAMEVFGAGDYSGVGMAIDSTTAKTNEDGVTAAAIIDLMRGRVKDVFGASYKEGVTRRTIINVPAVSTIRANRIFGGAYGITNEKPCDVFEANINYSSANALVGGYRTGIFGGNNNYRRTLYSIININSPVFYDKENDYVATVFGAGYGENSWSQYTEVNLNEGARVYEVYGGGYGGMVLNEQSVKAWTEIDKTLGGKYVENYLENALAKHNKLGIKCNTNVNINKGANVSGYLYGESISGGYCYAGGYGATATVSGSTYIGLHGGSVYKDLYAGGTSGAVMDKFKLALDNDNTNDFVATTNAYIEGGTVRNVYGGGWEGDVGYHDKTTTVTTNDVLGKTNVVIGIRQDQATLPDGYGFYKGVPAILRNAYGGGEGGAVFGQTNLNMNNGYIGYTYNTTTNKYEEKVNDETWTDHVGLDRLSDCGNLFGGGYDDNSSVDSTNVTVWGGVIRNSVFGGGEIATIGRGKTKESGEDNKNRVLEDIYKSGKTNIEIFNGHVKRNVFGGGKGYNILGYGGVHGFYTDGYVFGQTEVHIHGGEIGTAEGVAQGYGNVFGGGDVGYVYGPGVFSDGTTAKVNTGSPNHIYYYDAGGQLTEDCKVVIAPMLQLKPGKTASFGGKEYGAYDYVPTEYLNTLPTDKTATAWRDLFTGDKKPDGSVYEDDPVERGIQIRNAVFAGGNVSSNSESYSNATTVFGNTTATLYDVFHRDFITVGTEHTGGLYGGGNLSIVDGYRELNITNYGTDYYGMNEQISLEEYQTLTNRERAYFKLEYVCQQANLEYQVGKRIDEDEYNNLPDQYRNETYWKQYGFCSIYAGRLLNTIQRADFCGVFGSRLVLQGAKDRVADVGDATEYTINRVGELSLNQQRFDPNNSNSEIHGNYFGIYSIVNYLGNLTSDVRFADARRYVDGGEQVDNSHTYLQYKVEHLDKRDRNNGTSYNQVALASGVYLEITSENSTPSNKIYGDITGVVELDLINVKKDIEGGGYVYARNEHGQCHEGSHENTLLSPYNKMDNNEALTKKIYTYSPSDLKDYQTSGNFIHKSKRIVDDCYPNNGIYNDGYVKSPAHYWFIKGEVYIYDQVVSAYAGSASAYSKEVKIPLTITAGSNGKLQLLNVQPSLYAYRNENGDKITADGVKVDNDRVTYYLNDVISWWDWNQLSQSEQSYFVKETLVNVDSCTIDGTPYSAGTCVFEATTDWPAFQSGSHTVLDSRGETVTDLTNLFRSSNNISHNTGYVLTLDMNSPKDWDDWYTPIDVNSGLPKLRKEEYEALSVDDKKKYCEGPTYTLKAGEGNGLYGQRTYAVGEIISKETYDDYTTTVSHMAEQPTGQASVEPAYVALTDFGNTQAGNAISQTAYNALADKSHFAPAMVCVNTIQLGDEEYILLGELVDGTDQNLDALADKYMAYNNGKINADPIDKPGALKYIKDNLSNAYYITYSGLYGGQYFESGTNYKALKTWCTLTESRDKFDFNYDALDVLVDPQYHGEGNIETYYHTPYSEIKPVEYEAAYTGGQTGTSTLTYTDGNNVSHTLNKGDIIPRDHYENYIKNEQLHYTRIQVEKGNDTQTVYIVTDNIINNGTPYAKGQDISEKDYNALTDENLTKVATVNFDKSPTETQILYYCFETYTPSASFSTESGTAGAAGSVISANVFNGDIPNNQKDFTIQGAEPTETTTLYVSRESNAKDVTSEKIISVVYQYTYYEADDEGEGVSLVNELHVVNIHLKLESGAPEIGPLTAPPAVLPGNTVGLKAPSVNPGLYEVLTNGWELFASEEDAELHRNGVPFVNNGTPLYWYQNQEVFLAFYSKTYLGKTYSNYVPLTVANYHDLDAVMKDKEHHLYVDHPDVKRNSKIYIDNRDCESDPTKSELDLLKDFFDLSVGSSLPGHASLDSHVEAGKNLEFILNSNVSPKAYATNWTPIGDTHCFEGTLHGDGYTISGLDHSLFGRLCGNVYNLGVTGSFTSAGIVDTGDGYVENCWISTTGTPDANVRAVFGNPSRSSGTQIVNCYYPATKTYSTNNNGRGLARPMSETEFYNGTVAYNLNGFYLNKRYYDKTQTNGTEYQYLKDVNGTLSENLITGYYPDSYAFYPLDPKKNGRYGYVEDRYTDGDFIYAGGTIPEAYDARMRVVNENNSSVVKYAPIWPDDYIFFGQTLNYGYNSAQTHEDLPAHIVKSAGRLPINDTSNRVYRAPAYYQSKEMDVAHYNLWAILAANSAPKTITDTDLKPAYPNMTAIDFAGHEEGNAATAYKQGYNGKLFYQPLLDNEDGLLNISNEGETPNLLVYAPSSEVNEKTYNVLSGYFVDPDYTSYYIDDANRCVKSAPTSSIHGHLIQSNLKATNDHLLVDKRDFNCPISYTFADGKRMWYQRLPDLYVDTSKGWETVSLPFTAELVTTQQKGEITHFYSGSRSIEGSDAKIGHEYWLREYQGGNVVTEGSNNVFKGIFNYPTAEGDTKTVGNTFLWTYYYAANSQKDANTDTYQTYYETERVLPQYPLLKATKPYIVGFPGTTYYEFDLSGEWKAENTAAETPEKLDKQVITFASYPSNEDGYPVLRIAVSDDEPAGISADGYTFRSNYSSKAVDGYLLNAVGNSFDLQPTTAAVPFRPYFVGGNTQGSRRAIQHIIFDTADSPFAFGGDDDPKKEEVGEDMLFTLRRHEIGVTSALNEATDVRIFNVSGVAIASFTIQPGETVNTYIPVSGVYIVRAAGGRYQKKLAVK